MDKVLAWSIENSAPAEERAKIEKKTDLNPEFLAQLLGAPDEAQLMKQAMAAIESPEVDLENKEIAFDNFLQLCEGIDNANNLDNLKLWGPLMNQLSSEEEVMRKYAAWTMGVAVQNNPKAQEKLLSLGGVEKLVELTLNDPVEAVRLKGVLAISSVVRNFEEGLKRALELLPEDVHEGKTYDNSDMENITGLINNLRAKAKGKQ